MFCMVTNPSFRTSSKTGGRSASRVEGISLSLFASNAFGERTSLQMHRRDQPELEPPLGGAHPMGINWVESALRASYFTITLLKGLDRLMPFGSKRIRG
jgi:hypothetical protein